MLARSWIRPVPSTVALLLVGFSCLTGCKKAENKPEAPPAAATPAMQFAVGDKVDVKWNASWWKAEVLAVNSPKYRVHYVGWSASWDEDVTTDRVRPPTDTASTGTEQTTAAATTAAATTAAPSANAKAAPSAAATSAFKVGDKVDVNWNGQWWQGQVLTVSGSQYKVHYLGWAASWDETVSAARVRAPTASAKRGSGA